MCCDAPKLPTPPDYLAIAQSDAKSAARNTKLGEDTLQWGKDQFNKTWPYAKEYMQQQTESSAQNTQNARDQKAFYDTTYKPIETKLAGEAQNYNNPTRADQNAGAAMADVATTFDQQRTAALSNLESYGIDPSQTRFGALDLGTRISQAAATAGAGTQSRLNTEATGLALEGEAVNTGRGYSNSIAQSYNTATNSGKSGIDTANNTSAVGGNLMGSPASYFGNAQNNRNNQVNAQNTGFSNQMAGVNAQMQQQGNQTAGTGALIGGALTVAASFL